MLGSNFESFVPTAVVSTPLSFFLFFVDGFNFFAAVPAASRSADDGFPLVVVVVVLNRRRSRRLEVQLLLCRHHWRIDDHCCLLSSRTFRSSRRNDGISGSTSGINGASLEILLAALFIRLGAARRFEFESDGGYLLALLCALLRRRLRLFRGHGTTFLASRSRDR